ncbi:MAG: RNA 2',3'-cyclic phosphodiesterase [Candidatus Krumholzibacteriota bacterium]|nr:RNA 2',3'-cyclic phosphodiesterase [Candidatus Krumholzibacteriota bacterium]
MRLFFAVPVPADVRRLVAAAVRACPAEDRPWRWIAADNFHLTLKFLGETDDGRVDLLVDAAARAVAGAGPFSVRYGAFHAFPSLARPRVLVYEVAEGAETLGLLANRIDEAVEPLGFERERRPFRAHLTVARVRRQPSPETIAALGRMPGLPPAAAHAVDRALLMQSRLGRGGAVYEEIASLPLGETG